MTRRLGLALAVALAASAQAAEPPSPVEPPVEDIVTPAPQQPFELLGDRIAPGSRQTLAWRGASGDDDADAMPVTVVHGARPGPVLCLVAAIHGDELNGVEIVRRVSRRGDPAELAGTLIAVPVANLGGYARGTRYLPDRRDLNRAFPGNANGSAAARLAHGLFQHIVRHCDALVDFHTGSLDRDNLPQLRVDLRQPAARELARGFGDTVALHSPGTRGMLRNAANAAAVPAVTFEVGAPGVLQPTEIDHAATAIERLMQGLGMRAASPTLSIEPQAVFYDSHWVRADSAGLLLSVVSLGQRVTPGQRLGRVVDPLRDREVDVLSPFHGRVLGMAQNRAVLPGFALFHLGEETSEAEAVQEAEIAPDDAGPDEEDPAPPGD